MSLELGEHGWTHLVHSTDKGGSHSPANERQTPVRNMDRHPVRLHTHPRLSPVNTIIRV